ncbi:hypothetical protein D9615_002030 [Tricholomella constricta]|uniref:Mid2 domain-containing protein n=1 Tax=Tricholomella constricta TaxID=117010 RepID=A0A8H5MAC8_9AGAR|nr:hypothetical protein D9615_002030 [Tricholomella constricta]
MPLLHILGLRECLVLALVSLAAQALELSLAPTSVTQEETCHLTVITSGRDPHSVDLFASCDFDFWTWHLLENNVDLKQSNGPFVRNYNLTGKLSDFTLPISCKVVAAHDKKPLGSSNSIKIVATSSDATMSPTSTSLSSVSASKSSTTSNPSIAPKPSSPITTSTSDNNPSQQPAADTSPVLPSPTINSTSSRSAPSSLPPLPSSTSVTGETPTGINSSSPPEGKSHVGAIIGGIIGGVSTLILIVALLYVCRRRRSRLYLAKCLDFLRTVKSKAPASNTVTPEKEDWLVQVDGAMAEAAKQTERARSRTENNQKPLYGSNGHYDSDGYQTPDLMEVKAQQADFRNVAMTTSTPSHADEEWESHDHIYDGGYSTLVSETGEGSDHEPGLGPWGHPDGLDDSERQSNASSIPDINEMDPEAREKRRDAILERMREVLDGEPQGPGFVVL